MKNLTFEGLQTLLRTVLLCSLAGCLTGGCFRQLDTSSVARIVVQDSTGKPLSGLSVSLVGIKNVSSYTTSSSYIIEQFFLNTDQAGSLTQKLLWHDGISYYDIRPDEHYDFYNCGELKTVEDGRNCRINSTKDYNLLLQAKKVR